MYKHFYGKPCISEESIIFISDLEMIDQERCKQYGPWVTDYDICMSMETRTDMMMVGDSGIKAVFCIPF